MTVSAFPAAALAGEGYYGHRYRRFGNIHQWGDYTYRRDYRTAPESAYRRYGQAPPRHYAPRIIIPRYRPYPVYSLKIFIPLPL